MVLPTISVVNIYMPVKDDRAFKLLQPDFPQILVMSKYWKKIGVTGKIWEKACVKVLRDLTEKSVKFSALGTSDNHLSLFFSEVDQRTKLVRLVKKSLLSSKKNAGKWQFLTKHSPFLSTNFMRGSTVYGDCYPS